MKIAVIGSTNAMPPDIGNFLPPETTEIIPVFAADRAIIECAAARGIPVTEFPRTRRPRASARRTAAIIEYADMVLVFWDGRRGKIKAIIDRCNKAGIPTRVFA